MPGCRGTLGGSATIVEDDGGSGVGAKADPGGSPLTAGVVVAAAAPPPGPCAEAARRAAKRGPTGSPEISAAPGPAGIEVVTAPDAPPEAGGHAGAPTTEEVIAITAAALPSLSEARRSGRADGAARSATDAPALSVPGASDEEARSPLAGEVAARWGWPRPRTEDDPIRWDDRACGGGEGMGVHFGTGGGVGCPGWGGWSNG